MILIVQGQNNERKLLVAGVRMQLFDVKCILYSILKLHWKCSLYFYLDRLAAKKARICYDIECYLCLSSTKEVEDDLEKFLRNVKKNHFLHEVKAIAQVTNFRLTDSLSAGLCDTLMKCTVTR